MTNTLNKIVELDISHIPSILQLESTSAPDPKMYYRYTKEYLEEMMSGESFKAFGIFKQDELIAWSSYRIADKENGKYEMSSLVVHKDFRRNKIGLSLFNYRLNVLLNNPDVKEIYATAHPSNTPIICLYLNNGFEIYDFEKHKYGPEAHRLYLRYSKINKQR